MSETLYDQTLAVIRQETEPLVAARPVQVIGVREWWGVGLVLEIREKVSVRVFADYRDQDFNIEFMAPEHLDAARTFVTWPHCDDARQRFSLWEVAESQGLPTDGLPSVLDGDLDHLRSDLRRGVALIIERYQNILDGDLSVGVEILEQRRERRDKAH